MLSDHTISNVACVNERIVGTSAFSLRSYSIGGIVQLLMISLLSGIELGNKGTLKCVHMYIHNTMLGYM